MKHSDLGIIAVGEPLDTDLAVLPEGCHFNYDISGYWLHYLYQNPTQTEIESIQKGEAQFGLYTHGPIIFLLHQFGAMSWHDAAYSWWLVPPDYRKVPDDPVGHALLKTVMVDTSTRLVVALRACTFSEGFTQHLNDAIQRQSERPWSRDEHERAVRRIYSQYSTVDLVNMAEVFCKGGE